jgi:putative cell surface protein
MNKKFLSVILFGALMTVSTGTFVSCKDYDDDINNLQEQIDGQKNDLNSKITAVESSISSLQTAQSSLQSEIAAAKDEASKAALTAQEAAIATAKAELEKVKAELQAADKADMATVDGKLAEISGRIQTLEQFKTTTETTLAALSAADTNLQKSITTLQADVLANAEQIGRNKAAIEAQIAALEAYKGTNDDAIAGLKADLEKLQAGELTEAMVAKIAAQVTEVVGAKLELISAAFSKAVTHVELLNYTFGGGNEDYIIAGASSRMDLRTTLAVEDRVFGKGSTDEVEAKAYTIANQKEFKKGERAFLTDSVLIRVSPTNATLTEGQISFVNSALGNLDKLVTVEKVEQFKGTVVTRGISANGLWKVVFKLNKENYTEENYLKAAKFDYKSGTAEDRLVKELNNISYAVAVTDKPGDVERNVTSGYDLFLGSDYEPQYELTFKVNDKNVSVLRNRFQQAEDQTYVADANKKLLYDYRWNVDGNGERVEKDGSYKSIDASYTSGTWRDQDLWAGRDNRNTKSFFSTKVGEKFTVELDGYDMDEISGIYGFYIVLDEQRAVESAPSEIRAWNSYESDIKGLNTITTNSKIEMSIDTEKADGDIIGFRVYAVNHDGSLVDPDGKAFYVAVGDIDAMTTTLKADYIPVWNAPANNYELSVEIALDEEIQQMLADMNKYNDYTLSSLVVDQDNNPTTTNAFRRSFNSDYDKLIITLSNPLSQYKDNGTYKMYFNFINKKDVVAKKVAIEITKKLPEFPAAFSAKANQFDAEGAKVVEVTDGNWNSNPVHNLGTAFNGISNPDNSIIDHNYTFTCSEKKIVFNSTSNDNRYGFRLDVNDKDAAADLFADKSAGKIYDINVSYIYNNVSSESADNSYTVKAPAAKNFKLRLVCGEGFTSEWKNFDAKKNPVKQDLKYADAKTEVKLADILKFKKGGVDYASTFSAVNIKECHLASNSVDDEYFTVTFDATNQSFVFTSKQSANPPAADVTATLKFTMVDSFGHENAEEYPYFTIKK